MTQVVGPCLRIIGDRLPFQVKAAILGTLSSSVARAGPLIKSFIGPMQVSRKSLRLRSRSPIALSPRLLNALPNSWF